ncbi:MAG: hypothetical protein A3D67_01175 [Candidatus Lloydbacteria bacterium RIFCSPHIGHO2_02_FULL_51_22]|uniref:Cytochrome C biogenesis protein transmembrane domain-containing protein n=2 Tax=Candidatus Lloydiibacteriota TaxID=1817910 RepID=A0A1G2DDD8_9BACT|nr:MAG: hypothetical protein A3D67_01175 [Candidatus Lloydbacteria bacterium RIFCSPHIGHO2_02_FULL_51_22]OGZ15698.1 MAG: hypothetical protein A3J08_01455 [Candidatus Lloydbacteria bacterium RIFCSPLOWO2_02_FULL_51_11]
MDIIFSASIFAAFLAGMVALFAPCCITVLLPAYIASAFREKKRILRMTLVFFAGISLVLVPIGMGAASLATLFSSYHKEMYLLGAALMFYLAILSVRGKGLTLFPMPKRFAPSMENGNASASGHYKSVFLLGVFSGAATSCCAPVLAGAVALAVISGAFWKALVVTFAYVFGMTIPLFIAAYFYDKYKIENSRFVQGKILEKKIFGKTFRTHSTNLAAGAVFLLMSVVLMSIAFSTGSGFWSPAYQVRIGEALNRWSQNVFDTLSVIPDLSWAFFLAGLFVYFVWLSLKRTPHNDKDSERPPRCH